MAAKKKKGPPGTRLAENRKARHDYFIEETVEAGIMLTGSEVKSLRKNGGNIAESYASAEGDEMWLINAHIPEYTEANRMNHAPRRPRKLLLHRREINKLGAQAQRGGYTIVPLTLYFNNRGIVKCELGVGKGKKLHDKRDTAKQRDWNRQKQRLLKENG